MMRHLITCFAIAIIASIFGDPGTASICMCIGVLCMAVQERAQ
jgi:uncharacterized membrane protein YtjA (UPF0391 family)